VENKGKGGKQCSEATFILPPKLVFHTPVCKLQYKEALIVAYCNQEGVPRKQECCTVKISDADHDEFRADYYL
jgi:hypothetical protein